MGSMVSYIWGDGGTPTDVFETEYGCIRGKKFPIGGGRYVNAFLSVPYAKPPIGDLRFKVPMAPDEWIGIRECTAQSPRPPQIDYLYLESFRTGASKSEDCLYLNVFAPEWKPLKNEPQQRAVLVWIHGGGFVINSAASYGDVNICKSLCSKDVIVVSVGYRLGILGFAATGDSSCVPNLGLRDQAFALAWIKRNIAFFGGDPNNVTVLGQSAGAVCADILSVSPYSTDLCHRVILMAGSASCHLGLSEPTYICDLLRSHARALGWTTPQGTEEEKNVSLMKFLKARPVAELEIGAGGVTRCSRDPNLRLNLTPVVDGDFLPSPISELRTKLPPKTCIFGVTEFEALWMSGSAKSPFSDEIDRLLERLITEEDHANYEKLRKEARELYVSEGASEEDLKIAFIKLSSDTLITNGTYKGASEMLHAGHRVYLYTFEYFSSFNLRLIAWSLPFLGPTHCTDLPYIFGKGILSLFRFNENDRKVLENFTTLFTNFAKHGDVNGGILHDLLPLEEGNEWRYISVGEEVTMKEDFHGRRADFWRQIEQPTVFLS